MNLHRLRHVSHNFQDQVQRGPPQPLYLESVVITLTMRSINCFFYIMKRQFYFGEDLLIILELSFFNKM